MSEKCRNPECKNGSTPGLIASGKGTSRSPTPGVSLRYGWVNCRACSPKDKDPPFELRHRSPEEIAERARLADTRAAYVKPPDTSRLAMIKSISKAPVSSAPPPETSAQLSQLIDTVSKLSSQVAELLAENARLRSQQAPEPPEAPEAVPTPPRRRKSRQIAKVS